MDQITVAKNQQDMRDLALEAMRFSYAAAADAEMDGRLKQAAGHLAAAEKWRERARSHGSLV